MPRPIDRAVSTLPTVTTAFASFAIIATLSAAPAFAQERDTAAAPQVPQPTQTTPATTTSLQELLGRQNLFGDWGGARTKMQNAGTKFDVTFTQFFQWAPQSDTPPLGDVTQHYLYGGKFDVMDTSDLSKIAWKGLSVSGHLEVRYGDVPLLTGGTLIPTNTALLFPEAQDTKARLSALNFTQVLNSHAAVSVGRFNMVDLYDRAYTGGRGIDKFMNLSFVMPTISVRTVPPVAEGVIFSILNGGNVVATAGLIESTDEGFFKNGATVLWNVTLPVHLFTKPGHYAVGGEFSSTVATSLDQSAWLLLPPFNNSAVLQQGAWTLNVSFDQAIAEDPNDSKKTFGLFGVLGVSDANPTPIQPFFTLGVGGHSLLRGRENDTFGVAYAFNGMASDFVTFVQPARIRSEQGGELYYNFAVAPWSLVTADLQFVDPYALGSSTRTFFAVRWKLIF
jgi:porin